MSAHIIEIEAANGNDASRYEVYYNCHLIHVVQCSTSVKTEWRAFYGDLYDGRFLAEADTVDEVIRLAETRIDQELACAKKNVGSFR